LRATIHSPCDTTLDLLQRFPASEIIAFVLIFTFGRGWSFDQPF
jgi:hypothetical protein